MHPRTSKPSQGCTNQICKQSERDAERPPAFMDMVGARTRMSPGPCGSGLCRHRLPGLLGTVVKPWRALPTRTRWKHDFLETLVRPLRAPTRHLWFLNRLSRESRGVAPWVRPMRSSGTDCLTRGAEGPGLVARKYLPLLRLLAGWGDNPLAAHFTTQSPS